MQSLAAKTAADMPRLSHISPHSFRPLILAGAVLLLCLSSCSRVQSIREAQQIVAEADSLRSAGQSLSPFTFHLSPSKSDSATIASAVSALEPLRLIYPTAYAHANYYYGRLLRGVVHSCTKDHEIIARAYANIASMCRRAQEYPLSCQMDFFSARHFLANNDSIHYYYSLNNVAFDYAELNEKQNFMIDFFLNTKLIRTSLLSAMAQNLKVSYISKQYNIE